MVEKGWLLQLIVPEHFILIVLISFYKGFLIKGLNKLWIYAHVGLQHT